MIQSTLVAQQLTVFENDYKVPKAQINQLRVCIIGYSQTGLWKVIHTITEFVFGLVWWSQWHCALQVLVKHPKTHQFVQTLTQTTEQERAIFQLQRLIDLNKWKTPATETASVAPATAFSIASAASTPAPAAIAARATTAAAPYSGITIAGHPLKTNGQLDTEACRQPAQSAASSATASMPTETMGMVHAQMNAMIADPTAALKAVAAQWKEASPAQKRHMRQQMIAGAKMVGGLTDAEAAEEVDGEIGQMELFNKGGEKALRSSLIQSYQSMTAEERELDKKEYIEFLIKVARRTPAQAEAEYDRELAKFGLRNTDPEEDRTDYYFGSSKVQSDGKTNPNDVD